MKFRYGAMSVGDILDRSLKLLFSRLGTFYVINLIVQSPLIAVTLFVPTIVAAAAGGGFQGGGLQQILGAVVVGVILFVFLFVVLQMIGMAAILKVVEQEHIDHKIGVGAALGFAMTRLLPLLAVTIILGLVVCLGFFMCLIPGFIFLCMYAFAVQAVVIEGLGPLAGMTRSAELTQGWRLRIFGILFLVGMLNGVVTSGLDKALQVALPSIENVRDADGFEEVRFDETNYMIDVGIEMLLSILVSTFGTICLTLTYFDLRTRKEGFDLELAARGVPQVLELDEPPRQFHDGRDFEDFPEPRP